MSTVVNHVIPDPLDSTKVLLGDDVMENVHQESACASEKHCVIHRPSDHPMRAWPLHWRNDRGIFERICVDGVGHPDPDQFEFWEKTGRDYEKVHGCDGCCLDVESQV